MVRNHMRCGPPQSTTLGGMDLPRPRALTVGQIYYIIQYEDEKLTRPVVSSFVYKGRSDEGPEKGDHLFSLLGLGDSELFLSDRNLDIVLDKNGLIKELSTPNLAHSGIDHAS